MALKKHLKFLFLTLFALFLLWFFGKDLDWGLVRQSLAKADAFWVSLAVAIICLGYFLRAIRWKVLLEPITGSSLRELFATTTVGFAAIFLVGRAGEIVRPMWLPMRDKRVRPSAALVTLGLERLFDLAALSLFFAVNLIWFQPPAGRQSEFRFVAMAGFIMLGLVIVGFFGLIYFRRNSQKVITLAEKVVYRPIIPTRVSKVTISILQKLAGALSILSSPQELLLVSFWTLLLWFAIALPTWFVLLAFGLPITFTESLFIMGFASVSSVVPTPGGAAGAFHTATAASVLFIKSDIQTEDAAAISIAMHLVYFAPAVVFGFYYFIHGDISWDRFKNLLSGEHAVEEIESEPPNGDRHLTAENRK